MSGTTLNVVPNRWFLADLTVTADGQLIAEIERSWWTERATLKVHGASYDAYSRGPGEEEFVLAAGGTVVATAAPSRRVDSSYRIAHGGRQLVLRPKRGHVRATSAAGAGQFAADGRPSTRVFVLSDGARTIGSLSRESRGRARADLPADVPLPVRTFIIWLTVTLWRREVDLMSAGLPSAG